MLLQVLANLEQHHMEAQNPMLAIRPAAPGFAGDVPPAPAGPIVNVTLSTVGAMPAVW